MMTKTTTITGNTYPVKEAIKALGGRWNRAAQGWDVPTERAEEARRLVDEAGPSAPRPTRSGPRGRRRYYHPEDGGSTYTRFAGGAEVYTNRRGRCEDAPCCGCCS